MLPKVETILFTYLLAEHESKERKPSLLGDKPHANASSAGNCARAIGFRILGVSASNPMTGDSLFNFYLGDAVHEKIQAAMLATIPGAVAEVDGVIEDFITCRSDLCYSAEDSHGVCAEIKSVSDFAYKLATGETLKSNGRWNKKDQKAEGPKREHILQAGISAKSVGAKYFALVYARKTAAKDEPVIHEWRFRVADYEQEIEAEIDRLRAIVGLAKHGKLPRREYEGNTITDPSKIRFPCGYCSYLDLCQKAGEGVVDAPQS